jgi:HTH-type transcriptional regulator / antitoxin HigA
MPKLSRVAKAFPPGEFLREELEARGWSDRNLAKILGKPAQFVAELLSARRQVDAATSLALSAAFGTDPKFWLNLESSYQIWLAGKADPKIAKRAAAMSRGARAA